MKITILGSGTCIPNINRGSSGYFIDTGNNKILFDCGNGTTWKLEHIGICYTDITHIYISHIHPDHTADLIPFLFANKYPYNRKRTKQLEIWGPPGFLDFYSALNKIYNDWLDPELLQVYELEQNFYEFNDFTIINKPGNHSIDSLIYRIECGGKSVVYSADTDYCKNLAVLSKQTDLLIAECSMTDDKKVKGHMSPKDIIKIANEANPKNIVLTHLYPICDEIDIIGQIKPQIESDIMKAHDMMEIIL